MLEGLRIPDLAGKRCLVTGASSGIGAAVALGLGAQGASVVVHGHSNREAAESVAKQIEAAGGKAAVLTADLSQRGAAADLIGRAGEALGGLDLLINNAGGPFARVPFGEASDDYIERMMAVNVDSLIEACRAAVPLLQAGRDACIINTTSIAARHGGGPGAILYAAAKGAVSTLTRGLAKEYAGTIRVNAVAPGVIATPLHAKLSSAEIMQGFLNAIPMRRIGTAEECVGTYLFLASPMLSGYVTGQVVEVNGGQLMP